MLVRDILSWRPNVQKIWSSCKNKGGGWKSIKKSCLALEWINLDLLEASWRGKPWDMCTGVESSGTCLISEQSLSNISAGLLLLHWIPAGFQVASETNVTLSATMHVTEVRFYYLNFSASWNLSQNRRDAFFSLQMLCSELEDTNAGETGVFRTEVVNWNQNSVWPGYSFKKRKKRRRHKEQQKRQKTELMKSRKQ